MISLSEQQTLTMIRGLGILQYMAPEIINKQKYNKKVDVYTFGVLLHFVLNGGNLLKIEMAMKDILNNAKTPSSFKLYASEPINSCQYFNPEERQSFSQIFMDLKKNYFKLLHNNNNLK